MVSVALRLVTRSIACFVTILFHERRQRPQYIVNIVTSTWCCTVSAIHPQYDRWGRELYDVSLHVFSHRRPIRTEHPCSVSSVLYPPERVSWPTLLAIDLPGRGRAWQSPGRDKWCGKNRCRWKSESTGTGRVATSGRRCRQAAVDRCALLMWRIRPTVVRNIRRSHTQTHTRARAPATATHSSPTVAAHCLNVVTHSTCSCAKYTLMAHACARNCGAFASPLRAHLC